MSIMSGSHWSRNSYSPEEREVAAVMLDDMRIQDPNNSHFGYYDPTSQIRIIVHDAVETWEPPVPTSVAERAGQLAMLVREDELSQISSSRR